MTTTQWAAIVWNTGPALPGAIFFIHSFIHSIYSMIEFLFRLGFDSGGSAYSYCGNMDQSVCCYVPRGARPVGLLPVLNKSKCGRKGNVAAAVGDRKRTDGLADLGEWPWHVSQNPPMSTLLQIHIPTDATRRITFDFIIVQRIQIEVTLQRQMISKMALEMAQDPAPWNVWTLRLFSWEG